MSEETHIAPSRKSKFTIVCHDIPVDLIDEDPDNAREHPEDNLSDIGESLDEYGLQKPISVIPTGDGRFRCLAGNGTLRTAKRQGAEVITAAISDLEGDRADGFAIADNQSAATSVWNFDRLAAKLHRLRGAGFNLRATCWRAPAIDEILKSRIAPPMSPFTPSLPTTPASLSAPAATASPTTDDAPVSPTTGAPVGDGAMAQHFPHWRTSSPTFELVARICGVEVFDLDTASNEHSIVPCRVSLHGGPESVPIRECTRGTYKPGGRLQVKACGLREVWPAKAVCWWNPPYDDIPTWLLQVFWHAARRGCGAGIIPGNLLETGWGQALLLSRHDLDAAIRQLVDIAGDSGAKEKIETLLGDDRSGDLRVDPDAAIRVFMVRGRVAFLDHRRPDAGPVQNNKGGSVLVFWGHQELSAKVQPAEGVWL